MNLIDTMDEIARILLSDRCLAMYERSRDVLVGEFCSRCQEKMGNDFSVLMAERFSREKQS